MPQIASGSSVTLTVNSTQQILQNSGPAVRCDIEATSGVTGSATKRKVATHRGGYGVYGPFGDGTVTLFAIGGVVDYDNTGPLQGADYRTPVTADPTTGFLNADGRVMLPDAIVGTGIVNGTQGIFEGQPIGITRPVRTAGRMVANFATGVWSRTVGTGTFTQGVTGFDANGNVTGIRSRTGMPEMVTLAPIDNATNRLSMVTPSTGLLTTALAGKIGLWVHLANQPGYNPGGSLAGTMDIEITTNGSRFFSNALVASFNTNQLREGWNFLKFVQRDPVAYQSTSPTTEYHPFGISAACYGTGVDANIVANAVTEIRINVANMSGATLTFDSMWTGFDSRAQCVLGCDAAGNDLIQYGLPKLQNLGWVAYFAVPGRIYSSGSIYQTDWTGLSPNMRTLYDAGWECVNHSVNHRATGTLTSAAEIDYEVAGVQSTYANHGTLRGCEFYASPQSSSSRLSDNVIRNRGFKLQRHARKFNVCVTPWGIDNPHHVGACDIGSASAGGISSTTGASAGSVAGWQTFTKIKRLVDVAIAYGDTIFPFWHGITVLGDTGSGDDLTGDNLLMTKSAFDKFIDYLADREAAGQIRVVDGITGFYYGVGR